MTPRLFALTLLCLLAFAGNSLLCRIALKQTSIDPMSFVAIRLLSGGLILWLVLYLRQRSRNLDGSWFCAVALLTYMMAFSYAYARVPVCTGALLLCTSVQISMILFGLAVGERLSFMQSIGVVLAISGLVILMLPRVDAPPLFYGFLMIVAGIAWSAYSLAGRHSQDPVAATAGNFVRAAPIALTLLFLQFQVSPVNVDPAGVPYAVASGAVTSGLSYILWYILLRELKVIYAATVQLSVPVLTTFGGAILLGETITPTLVAASALIVLGISLVVLVTFHA